MKKLCDETGVNHQKVFLHNLHYIEKFAEIRGEESWEDGLQQGIQQGEEAMQERMNKLFKLLLADKRYEDLEKSTEDKGFQLKPFEEYGI